MRFPVSGTAVLVTPTEPIRFWLKGVPLDAIGRLCIEGATPVRHLGGVGLTANNRVATGTGAVVRTFQGLPRQADGALVTTDEAAVRFLNGLPFSASGASPANGIQLRGDGNFSSYYSNAGTDGFRPELVLEFG